MVGGWRKLRTSSGSTEETFLPGLARSGRTHSLLGLAKTVPLEEEVSLVAIGVWLTEVDDVEVRLGGAGRLGLLEDDDEAWDWVWVWDWDWAEMDGRLMMGIFGSAPCPSDE